MKTRLITHSKRLLSIVLAVIMTLIAIPFGIVGFAETEDNFTYTVSNGKATITDYPENATGEVIIPETLGGYPVTSIGDFAFKDCYELTSIKIPDSVTSIGDCAFYCCYNLTSIKLSDSITTIGADAFACCGNLTSIKLPDTLTNIGNYAFEMCGLTSVKIPNSVTNIGAGAFSYSVLNSIELPNSITNIAESTFECSCLHEITIPDSVTNIGKNAFAECGLTSVTIGKNVANISDSAFNSCNKLANIRFNGTDWNDFFSINGLNNLMNCNSLNKHLYLGSESNETTHIVLDSVTNISEDAFCNCRELTSIEIGDSVTNICDSAFRNCGIISVTIGKNVTNIGNSAFSGCSNLTEITIPVSVTNIGSNIFAECSSLKEVTFENKETEIPFNDTTIPVSTVINCLHNSTAYKYALSFNREYVLTDEHNYNLKLSLPAGCAGYGLNMYECACGAEKNEIINPTGHKDDDSDGICDLCKQNMAQTCEHDYAIEYNEATCNKEGNVKLVCKKCNNVISKNIPVKEHSYIIHAAKAPTCSESGWDEYKTCTNCDYISVHNEYTALGHDIEKHTAKSPTCTEIGWEAYETCSLCNYSTYTEIPATGHTESEWIVTKEPTCTENGEKIKVCKNCKTEIERKNISENGHKDSDSNGYCDTCGAQISNNCSHMCHKGGIAGFIWKILNLFNKLFKINQYCSCGARHW